MNDTKGQYVFPFILAHTSNITLFVTAKIGKHTQITKKTISLREDDEIYPFNKKLNELSSEDKVDIIKLKKLIQKDYKKFELDDIKIIEVKAKTPVETFILYP